METWPPVPKKVSTTTTFRLLVIFGGLFVIFILGMILGSIFGSTTEWKPTSEEKAIGCVTEMNNDDKTYIIVLDNITNYYVKKDAYDSTNIGDFVIVFDDGSIRKI